MATGTCPDALDSMREQATLRIAGRTARIVHHLGIVFVNVGKRMAACGTSREQFRERHPAAGTVAEDDGRIGMRDQPLDLHRRSLRIERGESRADMSGAEMDGDGLEAIVGDPDNLVAASYTCA